MFKQIKIFKTRFKVIKAMRFCDINIEDNGVFELFNYLEWAYNDLTKKNKSEKNKFELAILICSYVNKYADDINLKQIKKQAIYELSVKWLTYHFPLELYDKYEIDKTYKINLEDTVMRFYDIRNEYFYQKLIFNDKTNFEIGNDIGIISHLVHYVYDNPCFDFFTRVKFKLAVEFDDLEPQTNFLTDERYMFKKMNLYTDLQYQISARELVSNLLIDVDLEKHYDYELDELLNE